MLLQVLLFLIGLYIIIKSADLTVFGASRLAKALGVSSVVIGLTVVAYGTSLPEYAVSVVATIGKNKGIAIGNIVGSNIANIALVLGLSALIKELKVDRNLVVRDGFLVFLLSILVLIFSLSLLISRLEGFILLLIFLAFLYYYYKVARNRVKNNHEAREKANYFGISLRILVGILGLALGSKILVSSAVSFATYLGIRQEVIGATLIAIGTSLPELVTSIVAAYRGFSGLSVGNILGSNIFNIGLVLGSCTLISPIHVLTSFFFDLSFMTLTTGILLILMLRGKLDRYCGILLISLYLFYIKKILITLK